MAEVVAVDGPVVVGGEGTDVRPCRPQRVESWQPQEARVLHRGAPDHASFRVVDRDPLPVVARGSVLPVVCMLVLVAVVAVNAVLAVVL